MSGSFKIKKVGIALAAYQPDPVYFREQLETIHQQTFRDWICVLSFDSDLASVRKISVLRPFFEDERFIWVENEKRLGHKKNFEWAIQLALSHGVDAIACADQDDVWYPEKLAICVSELEKAGPLSLVHSDMHLLQGDRLLPETAWKIEQRGIGHAKSTHLLVRNVVAGCAMLLDAELARRYPEIPEAAEYHDHWYALVASRFGGVHAINRPLYAYRQHGGNQVGVSPYHSLFWLPRKMSVLEVLDKCQRGWLKSNRLARAARAQELPLSGWDRILYSGNWDLGLGMIAFAMIHLRDDPALARACLSRGAGKGLTLLRKPASSSRS